MPSVLIGQTFVGPNDETFTITDFLGRGAFGEVYRAKGDASGTVVAVKLLPLGRLAGEAERIALLNEIKTARQVNHPNVVKVLHVDEGTNAELGPFSLASPQSLSVPSEVSKEGKIPSSLVLFES